jgi:hypothetical protein
MEGSAMTTETRRPDEWMVSDGMGEYVSYYNPTGLVMHFTKHPSYDGVWKTTSSDDAFEVARIAREVYKRKHMRMGMVS